ncbi:MAG TPA: hydroxymethylglutaryl-CoA synthase [Labilithrix sp.]|nr:hydroxymethylglutaryl-CoA synthase [Labilithrix sp.]
MPVGIEAINFYGGQACLDVRLLFERRGLNLARFDNLMMRLRSVALPCEDPVTHAVNAAKPIVSALRADEKSRIEMVIVASESGVDFGKSLSTYVHDYLALPRTCRLFEVKQACYGGTAALQMAASFVASQVSPGAKVLVVASDTALHSAIGEGGATMDGEASGNFAEPSSGTGAVAMLVGEAPAIFELDLGASGLHSYEVMDTCRPVVGWESGDADLSLFSYLDCLQGAFEAYCAKVEGVDLRTTFEYLAFHTPFPGMVKGAHRKAMRERVKGVSAQEVEADFQRRVAPSLRYCADVGNLYSGALYLALCGVLAQAPAGRRCRVGLFSYGSGCSSEFFSGVIGAEAAQRLAPLCLDGALNGRRALAFEEYERIGNLNRQCGFGAKDLEVDVTPFADLFAERFRGNELLVLKEIKGFHRRYAWS